jgi:hypothetical protein
LLLQRPIDPNPINPFYIPQNLKKDQMINDQTTGGMATELPTHTANGENNGKKGEANFTVKTGLARMLKGGVIMDVVNAEQVWIPFLTKPWYNGSPHVRQE